MSKYPLAVHVLLDASGSMKEHVGPTIVAFNGLVTELATAICPTMLSLSSFSDRIKHLIKDVPIYEAPVLDCSQYRACGGTAMADAMATAFKAIGRVDAAHKVIVLLTDGHDSHSRTYTRSDIKALVEAGYQNGLVVLFLAIDENAAYEAPSFGVRAEHTLIYGGGVEAAMKKAAAAALHYAATGDAHDAAIAA